MDGFYRVRIYRTDLNTPAFEYTPMMNGKRLPYIPFVLIGRNGEAIDPQKPVLLDLVDVNMSHYRGTADYEHALHFTALPTAVVIGHELKEGQALKIGSSEAWVFTDPQADAKYLEFSGQGLDSIKVSLERKEGMMATLGARILAPEKRDAEAAETAKIHRAGENSVLGGIALGVGRSLAKAFRWAAEWAGAGSGTVEVKLNTEFFPAGLTAQDLTALVGALQAAAISPQTFYDNMRRGSIIDDGVTSRKSRTASKPLARRWARWEARMSSLQTELYDATVRHAIDLVRYSNGVVRRIIALLNQVDSDLGEQITRAMGRLPASAFTVARLKELLKDVRTLNAEAYQQVRGELEKDLRDLAGYEIGYQGQLFDSLGIEFTTRGVTAGQVYAGAMAQPFQGRLLREWMAGLEAGRASRIRDAVRMGYVEGQTIQQVVQRVRGTRAKATRTACWRSIGATRRPWCAPPSATRQGLRGTAGTTPTTTSSARWPGSARWIRAPARCVGCATACGTSRIRTSPSAIRCPGAPGLAGCIGSAAARRCRSSRAWKMTRSSAPGRRRITETARAGRASRCGRQRHMRTGSAGSPPRSRTISWARPAARCSARVVSSWRASTTTGACISRWPSCVARMLPPSPRPA